jgi:hypothetical protein
VKRDLVKAVGVFGVLAFAFFTLLEYVLCLYTKSSGFRFLYLFLPVFDLAVVSAADDLLPAVSSSSPSFSL